MQRKSKKHVSNKEILDFLSSTTSNASFLQKLKIRYRPYVCPFDELLEYAYKVDSVYDVGCGSGQFAALVARFTPVKKIHGIEVDKQLVANAREIDRNIENKKRVTFSYFDGEVVPKNIKEYDLVYMIDVYHHIPKKYRDDIIRQIYFQMKPGARLMLKDINGASPYVIFNKLHDLIFAQEFSHEIGIKKAHKLLETAGFKIQETRKKRIFVYPHYFILAQK